MATTLSRSRANYQYSTHNLDSTVSFGMYASVNDQWSRPCGRNLRVAFLRMVLLPEVEQSARAMTTNGETKALISPPPRWVPAHNHQFVRTPSNPSSLRACLVRTVVARAFVNSHRTTSTGDWTRCISPAGQAHRSEWWYSGITLTPSRLWLHPPARTYSSKVAGRA